MTRSVSGTCATIMADLAACPGLDLLRATSSRPPWTNASSSRLKARNASLARRPSAPLR